MKFYTKCGNVGQLMEIINLSLGKLLTNCYIVFDESTKDAIVIDPADASDKIISVLQKNNLSLKKIFLTHGHYDHMLALDGLADATGAKIYVHSEDAEMLSDSYKNCSAKMSKAFVCTHGPDYLLHDGDTVNCGSFNVDVLHTPGHSKGSVSYRIGNSLFTGDLLFYLMIGCCDLYGGSTDDMSTSLLEICSLEGNYNIYPGHGRKTTLDFERARNIYIRHLKYKG